MNRPILALDDVTHRRRDMDRQIFFGTIPALMTPCRDDRTPDYDALVATGKRMIEAGMSAVVYCGSMGDWPLLTDEQRMEGVKRLCDAGVPVIVGTGAINTASAVAHPRRHCPAVSYGGVFFGYRHRNLFPAWRRRLEPVRHGF